MINSKEKLTKQKKPAEVIEKSEKEQLEAAIQESLILDVKY